MEQNREMLEETSILQRLPEEMLLLVFAKMPPKDIFRVRCVCKKWYSLLSLSSIRRLYSPTPTVMSSSFLVELSYHNDSHRYSSSHLIVDEEGKIVQLRVLNEDSEMVEEDSEMVEEIWGVSHNGLIWHSLNASVVSIPTEMCIYNPSVSARYFLPGPPSPIDNIKRVCTWVFLAMCFDPNNSECILLMGFVNYDEWSGMCYLKQQNCIMKHHICIYNSISQQWMPITLTMNSISDAILPYGNPVFSWGTFFWIDHPSSSRCKARVAGFVLSERKFTTLSLPTCPVHNGNDLERCMMLDMGWVSTLLGLKGKSFILYDPRDLKPPYHMSEEDSEAFMCWRAWELFGCDGSVFLLHNIFGQYPICWKLLRSEEGDYKWELMENDVNPFHQNSKVQRWSMSENCGANKKLWILGEYPKPRHHSYGVLLDKQLPFELFDQHGQSRASFVHQTSATYSMRVTGIWPFEVNNICWPPA